ncbi:3-hydroxyisobutyrate dehydrogenase [Legionella londiniensis]|uniref:3-hydroxyisobutyrate dehydrogenase n=1 Tax=Legionella londiniensis TaxID=45068 RepID=A0A0W0VJ75_9GAMM|nr:3-hydroxyisobutyrate dehydrogenase [Legionella londiniensis]KTD20163.1 3-hydroxyisobutyrate dehydrogenase [Legionella londiniensis]STX94330.1 3-hydroxyisobutyrate dehydrogenase [Legionella londiniensis]
MAKIGFVGLGHMGLPMAKNLLKAGHAVTGFDLKESALKAFTEAGGIRAGSIQESGRGQDILMTMLQTGEQVLEVCTGMDGFFSDATPGSLYIDCSSIAVSHARAVHEQAEFHQLLAVDAPVSGGVAGAEAATLTFMVGGREESFNKARPILAQMGKKIIHTGKAGSGQAAKICNNMILGISMIAISEAFVLAKRLGLSEKKLFEVVTNSSGNCWAMEHYVPVAGILENVPASHGYQPGFSSAMMLKDLRLSQDEADFVEIETPMGAKAKEIYQEFNEQGNADLDFSAIIQYIGREK